MAAATYIPGPLENAKHLIIAEIKKQFKRAQ
jgi:hypothetical protein